MRYILMMHAPRGTGQYQITEWKPEELTAHIQHMRDLNVELKKRGEFVVAEGLAPPVAARLVKGEKNNKAIVSDGPFAESKEFLVGFWMIDVDSEERAFEIAGHAGMAPGPGGTPMNIPIEVRPVMAAPLPDA